MGSIRVPNFPAFCCPQFELRCSSHCRAVSQQAEKWALSTSLFLDAQEEARLPGARIGLLASLCFPAADLGQLLAITKFLIIMQHWVDRPPSLYADEEIFDPIWAKSFRPTTRRDWHKRFQRHLAAFRLGQAITARDVSEHIVPDLESYITTRRDASGAKLLLDLIIYAGGLSVPQQVYEHPALRRLRQDAADIIAWSTDIAAYTRGPHACNLVTVVMNEHRFAPQGAIHFAGNLVKDTVGHFLANEASLAEYDFGDWDLETRAYVRGMRDCVVGTMHWMYETDRFFGDAGEDVKSSGWAFVQPA
ncbi:terpenoid synthase [Epithele typhae]|uniref:terpenoid synthase n=1 Tax=Epithele typhae TaxID=378194 RepID=UPI002007910A|nr:terpenoid synthase [Epithele typhae]KAH9912960.1 terpenoid synthase [Epithele typhae]